MRASENRIKVQVKELHLTDEEFNERFVPEKIKEINRLSILERYLRDLENEPTNPPSVVPSGHYYHPPDDSSTADGGDGDAKSTSTQEPELSDCKEDCGNSQLGDDGENNIIVNEMVEHN